MFARSDSSEPAELASGKEQAQRSCAVQARAEGAAKAVPSARAPRWVGMKTMKSSDLAWMRITGNKGSSAESMVNAALAAVLTVSDGLPAVLGSSNNLHGGEWTELPVHSETPKRMLGKKAFEDAYELGDKLGGGKFGNVFRAKRWTDKKAVAVKVRRGA